ncbi:MAG: DUF1080 domain-containing protein, partial [Bacteroidota bacterium]
GCTTDEIEQAPAEADAKAPALVSVFNGVDLSGWVGNTEGYGVEDGNLICLKEGGGNLYIDKRYSDFELHFEFLLEEDGNNGLGIRAEQGKDAAYYGMELQILDNNGPAYTTLEPWQYHGSVYGVAPAKRGFQNPVGEWNEQVVIAKGNQITVVLNGETILDVDIKEAAKPGTIDEKDHPGLLNPDGYIGFLGHDHRVAFRNIMIKELS